jgi:Domain of unknown function (DUF4145)
VSVSAPPSPVKGHCPNCGPDRLADVVGHHHSRYDHEPSGIWGKVDYRILQCRGCELAYFQRDEIFSEDGEADPDTGEYYIPHRITHWPAPPAPPAPSKRKQPDWASPRFDLDSEQFGVDSELYAIDSDLASLFDDIYVALNNDLRVLSAIGIRMAFDRASELLGVDPAKSFAEKLVELAKLGRIGVSEKDTLDILTDAGSAAVHRGWKPKPEELDTMMNIIETFLYRTFILDAAAKRLKQNVPARQKRQKRQKP